MNKQELFELIKNKTTITEEEFEKTYTEIKKELQDKGIEEPELEQYVIARMHTYYKKQLNSRAKKYVGYILFKTPVTDYGAQRKYDEIKEKFTNAPEAEKDMMIANGDVDADGNPLWNTPGQKWKHGTMIVPEQNKTQTIYLIAHEYGDGQQIEKQKMKLTTLTLRNSKIELAKDLPKYKLITFRANESQKSNDNLLVLNSASVTEFAVVDENDTIDLKKVLPTFLKDNCVDIDKLDDWLIENADNKNNFVITVGNIYDLKITSKANDLVILDSTELGLSDNATFIKCLIPKKENGETAINFTNDAMDVLIIGRPWISTDQDGNEGIVISVYDWQVDDIWKVKSDIEQITAHADELNEEEL